MADPKGTTSAQKEPTAAFLESQLNSQDETAGLGSAAGPQPAMRFPPATVPGDIGQLGKYRIQKLLGQGGMGEVYLAFDVKLERPVALKVMLPKAAQNPTAKERFLREARAAARINSDHVVGIYEADEIDGTPYIALQFLQGYPLDVYLKRKGTPSIPQIIQIGRETALGLAAAHQLGMVHRDIKPANIWLEAPNGRVKILDFGLAKPVENAASTELTASGALVGTPSYMAPEQGQGKPLDGRADLFSLGCMLYRLCTGKLPFDRPTLMATLMAIASEEPTPVEQLNPTIPKPLAELIRRLMAKDPALRSANAQTVAKELQALAARPKPNAEPASVATGPAAAAPIAPVAPPQVVYVPMSVSAIAPAANPFEELTADEGSSSGGEEPAVSHLAAKSKLVSTPRGKPQQAKGKSLPWLLIGSAFAGLIALVIGGVIIIKIINKDGSTTEIKVPDDSKIEIIRPKGTTPTPSSKPATTPEPITPENPEDRKAAEWILSVGGSIKINDRQDEAVTAANQLPKDSFRLTSAYLNGKTFSAKDLEIFRDCINLQILDLSNTNISDPGLIPLATCKSLRDVRLTNTKIGSPGLGRFQSLASLRRMELRGVAINEEVLAALKQFAQLDQLDLKQTKLTADEAQALGKALPRTRILWDGGTIEIDDPDLKAALFFRTRGPGVLVHINGVENPHDVPLPKERFQLTGINAVEGNRFAAGDLAVLQKCENVQKLIFLNSLISNDDFQYFQNMKHVVQLYIDGTQVNETGLAHLKNWRELKILQITAASVNAAGLSHLKNCVDLQEIQLIGADLRDADLKVLSAFEKVEQLRLRAIKIDGTGFRDLKNLTKLKILDLFQCKITDAGLAELKPFTDLEWLQFHESQLTSASIPILSQFKKLKDLHLGITQLNEAEIRTLAARMPQCKIVWSGGTIEPMK